MCCSVCCSKCRNVNYLLLREAREYIHKQVFHIFTYSHTSTNADMEDDEEEEKAEDDEEREAEGDESASRRSCTRSAVRNSLAN